VKNTKPFFFTVSGYREVRASRKDKCGELTFPTDRRPLDESVVFATPMRSGRMEAPPAIADQKILLIGGHRISGEPADPVDEYDPLADRWSESPRSRAHVWAATAASIDGGVLLKGGGNFRGQPVAGVREYLAAR
jgi:hypothetical protein